MKARSPTKGAGVARKDARLNVTLTTNTTRAMPLNDHSTELAAVLLIATVEENEDDQIGWGYTKIAACPKRDESQQIQSP